jgi:hypothetical protein
MHRLTYHQDGTRYGIKCMCGAHLLLETEGAKVEEGVDIVERVILTLHASGLAHLQEKNCD